MGQQKPPRLFFRAPGLRTYPGERKVRIALSGWADNESTVTELIKNSTHQNCFLRFPWHQWKEIANRKIIAGLKSYVF
jgi:hypothetical protein